MSRNAARGGWLLLALLALAQFISALDYNIVYVALPEIGREVGFSAHSLQWVISAYAVAFGGLLLLGGRAADLLGHRRMFTLALALYGISSLIGGLAQSPGLLLAARAGQGLGGALLLPATLSLINTTFAEGRERNRAMAVWGGAGAAGMALGSLLGGALTSVFGWESVFYVNVPLALGAVVASFLVIPADPPRVTGRSFDLPGVLTATAGFTALVFGVVQGPELGWTSPVVLGAMLGGLALIGLFLVIESRADEPLMPLALLGNRNLVTAMGVTFIFMGTFGSQYYFFTVYLQNVHGFGALATGLAFLPSALIGMLGTTVSEKLLGRLGARATILIGMLTGAAGMALLAVGMSADGGFAALLPGIIPLSLGQGIAWTAMFVAAGTGVAAHHQGIGSAMVSTTQQIGGAVGLAALVAVANAGTTAVSGPELVPGLQTAGWIAALVTVAGAGVALTLRSPKTVPAEKPALAHAA
ncbi:MFS transporter [Actinoplanes sp. OR16]|uniref:MFS transporter n=1 Tax=Actinoplanes sp. OR16 TaxID=946334 RepID=UPI000F6E4B3D|nr:MFS transporter [Actinoplanes sp. OR16]BBH69994.1 MFS transporter [Actinoplanes sp. OR16]